MAALWIDITSLPPEGQDYVFEDPALWQGPIDELSVPVRLSTAPGEALRAELSLRPEKDGVFITGVLAGSVYTPCARCAEEARVDVSARFSLFEEALAVNEESLEPALVRRRGRVLEFDAGGFLWEQFALALPVKALCSPDCPGLCPRCGAPLKTGPCGCGGEEGDPRMAALRNLKINPSRPQ